MKKLIIPHLEVAWLATEAASDRLTVLAAWQEVAPYSSRRHPSSLQRTPKYASLLRISGALHLDLFEQPDKIYFFSGLLGPLFYYSNIPLFWGQWSNWGGDG